MNDLFIFYTTLELSILKEEHKKITNFFSERFLGAMWVPQLVKQPALGFSSSHDLRVMRGSPRWVLGQSPSSSSPSVPPSVYALSLSLRLGLTFHLINFELYRKRTT